MLKKAGTLWILDEPFCSVDQKHTKSKMDTDSNTEKGKRSLIHHVLKPSAKKNIFPDVGCKKNQHKSYGN